MAYLMGGEIITVLMLKRATVDGVARLWLNKYRFYAENLFNTAEAEHTLEQCFKAEQHVHLTDVALLMGVAYPENGINIPSVDIQCYSYPHNTLGGVSLAVGEEPMPWEFVLNIKKQSLFGRAGRVYLRRALGKKKVNIGHDGKTVLAPPDGTEYIESRYYDAFMRAAAWKPVIVSQTDDFIAPTLPREVVKFQTSSVVKLRSVADAQLRKTYPALSYRELAELAAESVMQLEIYHAQLMSYGAQDVPVELVINLHGMIDRLVAEFSSVRLYWIFGVFPSVAPMWRPTAGLNPTDPIAQQACSALIQVADKWLESLGELLQQNSELVPKMQLKAYEFRMWQISTLYCQLMHYERWTGTPIPHPNP